MTPTGPWSDRPPEKRNTVLQRRLFKFPYLLLQGAALKENICNYVAFKGKILYLQKDLNTGTREEQKTGPDFTAVRTAVFADCFYKIQPDGRQ